MRDVLAHLLSSEQYNTACLDGTVGDFLAERRRPRRDRSHVGERVGHPRARRPFDRPAARRVACGERGTPIEGFRKRDGGDVDTSVGAYPARWQAFHLAFELAVHADDVGGPGHGAGGDRARTAWQAQFGRFALKELNKDLEIKAGNGTTQVRGDGIDVELPDAVFVQAVAARLGDDGPLDAEQRALAVGDAVGYSL